jgi:hypothetical protein
VKSPELELPNGAVKQAAEKVHLIVIPNEVRNLSGIECKDKERFLGTQRASE